MTLDCDKAFTHVKNGIVALKVISIPSWKKGVYLAHAVEKNGIKQMVAIFTFISIL